MSMLVHSAALICAGLFAGGAMVESVVEHPARLAVAESGRVDIMQRVLERADPYMPILAIAGCVAGIASFVMNGLTADLVGGLLLSGIIPFTLVAISPVNARLLAYRDGELDTTAVLPLMHRWRRLHALRSACGVLALVSMSLATAF